MCLMDNEGSDMEGSRWDRTEGILGICMEEPNLVSVITSEHGTYQYKVGADPSEATFVTIVLMHIM